MPVDTNHDSLNGQQNCKIKLGWCSWERKLERWNKEGYFIIVRKELFYSLDQYRGAKDSLGYHYHYQVGYTMPLYVGQQWEMLIDCTLLVGSLGLGSLRSEDFCTDMKTVILTWVVYYFLFNDNDDSYFPLAVCERL